MKAISITKGNSILRPDIFSEPNTDEREREREREREFHYVGKVIK